MTLSPLGLILAILYAAVTGVGISLWRKERRLRADFIFLVIVPLALTALFAGIGMGAINTRPRVTINGTAVTCVQHARVWVCTP